MIEDIEKLKIFKITQNYPDVESKSSNSEQ